MAFLIQGMKFGNHNKEINMVYKVISKNDFDYITNMSNAIKVIHRKADDIFVYPSGKIVTDPIERNAFKYVIEHFKDR